jgi:hypothetical protein
MWVRGSREKASVGEEINKILIVLMICLLDTVAAPGDFGELPS